MAKTGRGPSSPRRENDDPEAVSAFLDALDPPLKSVVEGLRATILGANPAITEGIKWASPSFYRHGWFATVNLRGRTGVRVVLHHGAKVREGSTLGATIDDPASLLTWMAKDRAIVTFADLADFQNKREAFEEVVRQWAHHQEQLSGEA